MSPEECQRVMREFEATWPRSDRNAITDEQVILWLRTLSQLEFEDALAALDALRQSSKFLPSHAEFREFAHANRRRRLDYEQTQERLRALPEPEVNRDVAAAWFRQMRAELRRGA